MDSLYQIVADLGKENTIGDCIGLGCSRYRLDQYDQLNKIATSEELIFLTDHVSPAVRYYAFRALTNRRSEKVFEILVKHMTDTMRVTNFMGCSGMEETVVWNLVRLVSSNFEEPYGYKLNKSQTMAIDSLIRRHPDPVYGPFAN